VASTEASLQAQLAVHTSWANTTDRSARTAPARAAYDRTFLKDTDGDSARAESARKAHYVGLQLLSVKSRRKAKEASAAAELAESELAGLGGEVGV
jgi:hypothetical protein